MEFDFHSFHIDVVAWLALALAGWSAWIAYRADRKADDALKPVIEVEITPLEPHWWTVMISARNRADYGLDGMSISATSPNGALLMTPEIDFKTDDGAFQARAATSVERAKRCVPFRLALAPRGASGKEELPGQQPEFEEDRKAVWLYLPTVQPQSVKLMLMLRTREHLARDVSYKITRGVPAGVASK